MGGGVKSAWISLCPTEKLLNSVRSKCFIEHSTTCDSRTYLNCMYTLLTLEVLNF